MNKIEAIVHLYKRGILTKDRALEIADKKELTDEEKNQLIDAINQLEEKSENDT